MINVCVQKKGSKSECIEFPSKMSVLLINVHMHVCVVFECGAVLHCEEAVGGRGGSAVEIILGFWPKSCARWADQGLREEWCYPVAVTQTRAFHLTSLAGLQESQPSSSIRSS